ncbi:MAG: MATE family efflux transporter [Sphingorhabdus sp.]|jgi:multidrug resistance protein, MATE family|uniref:MATE family efflux transporter n=1 Tax=Sphingorhabdus sp. TaxID=1902408 RepID=UPI00273D249F|nr:MATE family efflux transporter [Sphingorhabdus sp.]MDP4873094.1 MATE family efflux transporter [Sphingorhabdus sp.]MDP4927950.1 MATE family efflux transporter [Sphingorhabdus sp.]
MTTAAVSTEGQSPWRDELRATLLLAWPMILSNLTMMLIGVTDVILLGWLGPRELAAGALGHNLAIFCAIFCMGLVTATAPMMASEKGRMAHSVRDIRRTFRQGLWVCCSVMVPIWAFLWNTEAILVATGQQPDLAANAAIFVRAYMWSILPFLGFLVLRNFVAALEQPVWATVVACGAVVLNAVVNYGLILGHYGLPQLGLMGAGIGSTITNVVQFGVMALVVSFHPKFRRYHLFGRFWRPDSPRFRQIWRLGLPIGVTMGFEGGVFAVAILLMGLINEASVAAHAVAIQIASLTFMVPMGLGQAATVRVGLAFGRNDADGITKAGWTAFVLGTGFMAAMAMGIYSFPEALIGIFVTPIDAETTQVFNLAVSFLMVAAIFQIVDGAQVVGAGMLRGLHDTKVPMYFAAFGYWVVGIGVGGWLAFRGGWDGVGVWTGLATGLAVVSVLMLVRWSMRARLGLLPSQN